ncbi:uncharacterized protein LOC100931331 isoform X2 [Sarcophilus harrisii]|uniref:uncharacterized protein LOC100931331 isoform X2 n=1 Tax=Sarcophilus harrisii TaxID=9305 RepID=UPI001301FC19|nr:uncharacterized protein LOC100931331 isoform X2 [Sarcophilus harrisii]
MLYLQIEAQRIIAKKLQKEQELKYAQTRIATERKERSKSAGPSVEIRTNGLPESSNILPDSEWVKLSPQEKLSWAKNTQDPRIAIGQQSPLEKQIVVIDVSGWDPLLCCWVCIWNDESIPGSPNLDPTQALQMPSKPFHITVERESSRPCQSVC